MSGLASSREELSIARELLDNGHPRQAASRAYYAAFYAARAAVETEGGGDVPKTHSGLRSRFAELARSTPAIGAEAGRALSRLETRRTQADYGDEVDISAVQAEHAIGLAELVVDAVGRALERTDQSGA